MTTTNPFFSSSKDPSPFGILVCPSPTRRAQSQTTPSSKQSRPNHGSPHQPPDPPTHHPPDIFRPSHQQPSHCGRKLPMGLVADDHRHLRQVPTTGRDRPAAHGIQLYNLPRERRHHPNHLRSALQTHECRLLAHADRPGQLRHLHGTNHHRPPKPTCGWHANQV